MAKAMTVEEALGEIEACSNCGPSQAWAIVRDHIEKLAAPHSELGRKIKLEANASENEAMAATIIEWRELGRRLIDAMRLPPEYATVDVAQEQMMVVAAAKRMLGEDRV